MRKESLSKRKGTVLNPSLHRHGPKFIHKLSDVAAR